MESSGGLGENFPRILTGARDKKSRESAMDCRVLKWESLWQLALKYTFVNSVFSKPGLGLIT